LPISKAVPLKVVVAEEEVDRLFNKSKHKIHLFQKFSGKFKNMIGP
jgi:hypothetical protein